MSTITPARFNKASSTQQLAWLPQLIRQLNPDWLTGAISHIEFLSGGYSNLNFVFKYQQKKYVIRIPGNSQPYVDRHREAAWYQTLPAGLSVAPEVLDTASGIMITPWVAGELLVDAWSRLQPADLVDYLTRLHRKLPDPRRRYDVRQIYAAQHAAQADSPPLPPELPPGQPPPVQQACHNDLNPWNIVVTQNGWITLDWEFAGSNEPLFDLVSLHQGLALPTQQLTHLATSYCQQMQPTAVSATDLQQRLQHALHTFWYREFCWAQQQMAQGNSRVEVSDQLELSKQKLAALQVVR